MLSIPEVDRSSTAVCPEPARSRAWACPSSVQASPSANSFWRSACPALRRWTLPAPMPFLCLEIVVGILTQSEAGEVLSRRAYRPYRRLSDET